MVSDQQSVMGSSIGETFVKKGNHHDLGAIKHRWQSVWNLAKDFVESHFVCIT